MQPQPVRVQRTTHLSQFSNFKIYFSIQRSALPDAGENTNGWY